MGFSMLENHFILNQGIEHWNYSYFDMPYKLFIVMICLESIWHVHNTHDPVFTDQ